MKKRMNSISKSGSTTWTTTNWKIDVGGPGDDLSVVRLRRASNAGRLPTGLPPNRLVLPLLIFGGFALRLVRLSFQPLWWDEGWTFFFSSMHVGDLVARTAADIHPPLYYILLKLWMAAVGTGPVQARLFSVFVGTLTIPLIYILARQLMGRKAALAGCAVAVVAAFHVYYSQEVRMYGLLTLFSVLSSYALLRLTSGERSEGGRLGTRSWWIVYVLATTAALYTEYYAALVLAGHVVYAAVIWARGRKAVTTGRRRSPRLAARAVLLAWGASAALYAPWVVFAGARLGTYVAGKVGIESYAALAPHDFLLRHLVAWTIGHPTRSYSWLAWLAVIPALFAALGAWRLHTKPAPAEETGAVFLPAYLVVPLVVAYFINLRLPFHPTGFERLLMPIAPAYWLYVGAGIVELPGRSPSLARVGFSLMTLVGVLSLFVFYTAPRYPDDDYRPIMNRLRAESRPDDVLLAVHPWQQGYLSAYLPGERPEVFAVPAREWAADPVARNRDLDRLLAAHRRLWFPAYQVLGRLLEDEVAAALAQRAFPVGDDWYGNTRLYLFADGSAVKMRRSDYRFDGQIDLVGMGMSGSPVQSAYGVVTITLRWVTEHPPDDELRIAIRLTDSEDRTWAVRDSQPLNGLRPFSEFVPGEVVEDHEGLLVPAGTPPGRYTVELGLYRKESGRWLDPRGPHGQRAGPNVTLGQVDVVPPDRVPPPESLPIAFPLWAQLEDGIRFLGYSLPPGPFRPGEPLPLELFWQAQKTPSDDLRVFVQALDDTGKIWGARDTPPVEGAFPTSRWLAGSLVRDPQPLVLDPATPDGTYRLIVGLYRPGDGKRLHILRGKGRGRDYIFLRDLAVRGREHRFAPPADVGRPVDVQFGNWAHLVGYACGSAASACQAEPGGSLRVTLTWRATGHTTTPRKVFLHLEDDQGQIWGQSDQIPGQGAFPTTSWVEGEYMQDEHTLIVRQDTPPGTYRLVVGLYDRKTGRRTPVLDASGNPQADYALLQMVRVSPPPISLRPSLALARGSDRGR
jgi:4-amino-4-deoxy-L-arabinose transferase-like glycosyltransferase